MSRMAAAFTLTAAAGALTAASCAPRPDPAVVKEIEAFRAKHEADYTKEYVPLAGLFPLAQGRNSAGSADGNEIRMPARGPASAGTFVLADNIVRFEPTPGAALTVTNAITNQHQPIAGPIELKDDEHLGPDGKRDGPDELSFDDIALWVHRSGERPTIRMRDPKGEVATHFEGFHWFPIDVKYRVMAKFIRDATPREFHTPNQTGDDQVYKTEGVAEFTLDGQTIRLRAATTRPNRLYFIFRDGTSGKETYDDGEIPLFGSEGGRHDDSRFQPGLQPAMLVQCVHDVPAAASGEPADGSNPRRREGLSSSSRPRRRIDSRDPISGPSRRRRRTGNESPGALVDEGRNEVERLARDVARRGARPEIVWHSGKLRARQTAEAFWRACNALAEFSATRDLQPDDPPAWIRDRLRHETRDVLIAGHFPHLPKLLALLKGSAEGTD